MPARVPTSCRDPWRLAASFTCVANGVAVAGQYANLGSVTGTGPVTTDVDGTQVPGVVVDDEDPSHYYGVGVIAVHIEKATNGEDADTGTGPSVPVGQAVRWTYVITNTGAEPLTNLTVTDSVERADSIDCDGTGRNVVPGPLAPGESFSCTARGIAAVGQYRNIGTVVADGPEVTDIDGRVRGPVSDEDPSHYYGLVIGGTMALTGAEVAGVSRTALAILIAGLGLLAFDRGRRSRGSWPWAVRIPLRR